MRCWRLVLLLVIFLLLAAPAFALEREYQFFDLGFLDLAVGEEPPPPFSMGLGINESHQGVGRSGPWPQSGQAFFWEADPMSQLPLPPGVTTAVRSVAFDINDNGQIAGSYQEPFQGAGVNTEHGFYYSGGSSITLQDFVPRKVNNAGQIIGSFVSGVNTGSQGLRQGVNESVLPLAFAADINHQGQVAGDANFGSGLNAALWDSGTLQELAPLAGHLSSTASAINGLGDVVGWSMPTTGSKHLVKWSGGDVFDLGEAPDEAFQISAFNDLGQIVGSSSLYASLWESGEFIDLNEFVPPAFSNWLLASAQDINEFGSITGYGYVDGLPFQRAYLLKPVVTPEPISSALFLLGGGTLLVLRRRRT